MCIILGGTSDASPASTKIVHLTDGEHQIIAYSNVMEPAGERSLFLIIAVPRSQPRLAFATTADAHVFDFMKALMPFPQPRGAFLTRSASGAEAQHFETQEATAVAVPDWDSNYEQFEEYLHGKNLEMGRDLYEDIVAYYRRAAGRHAGVAFHALLVKPKGADLFGIFVRKASVGFVHIPMLDAHAPHEPLSAMASYNHRILVCATRSQPAPMETLARSPGYSSQNENAVTPYAGVDVSKAQLGISRFFATSLNAASFGGAAHAWAWPAMETVYWAPYAIRSSRPNGDLFSLSLPPVRLSIQHKTPASAEERSKRHNSKREHARARLLKRLLITTGPSLRG